MIKLLLNNRNLMYLVMGRLVSNMGDAMYAVASMWLVYELGGSALYSGLAGFLSYLPELVTILIGPIVDRGNKKKLLIYFELIQCVLIALIPILHFYDRLSVMAVLIITPLVSLCVQFTYPAESALLPETVKDKDLVQANSAMSFAYQGTSLVFRALAGAIVVVLGAVSIYTIDIVTFLVAALMFSRIKLQSNPKEHPDKSEELKKTVPKYSFSQYCSELGEGLQVVKRPLLFRLRFPSILRNFSMAAMFAALPAFADSVGGAAYYGMFGAVMTAGMLVGATVASRVSGKVPIGKLLVGSSLCTGLLSIAGFAVTQNAIFVGLGLLFLSGLPWAINNIVASSLTQKIVPRNMMGRVSATLGTITTVGMPFGALLGGWTATVVGAEWVMYANGFVFFVSGLYWLLDSRFYRLPIITEVDADILGVPNTIPNTKAHQA